MSIDFQTLVPAILAFIGGLAGSLVAPWINWGIEKRRNRFNYRKELITSWRNYLENQHMEELILESPVYSAIRPHLKPEVISDIENQRMAHVPGGRGGNVKKQMILDEVARIEKEWKLV